MQKQPQQNNPYGSAAGAYGENAKQNAGDPREVEARALLKSAQHLQTLYDQWDEFSAERQIVEDALRYNRTLWMMFYDNAIEDDNEERTADLRSNIVNLANFVFKRTIEIQSDAERNREKLSVLININREVASGLLQSVKNDQQGSTEGKSAQTMSSAEAPAQSHASATSFSA